jgi:hypothetical protein
MILNNKIPNNKQNTKANKNTKDFVSIWIKDLQNNAKDSSSSSSSDLTALFLVKYHLIFF